MVGRFIPESSTGGQGGGAHAASPVSCEMRAPPATTRQCVGPGRLRKGAFPCTDGTVTEVEATEGRAPRRVHLARAEPRVHESVSPGHRARQTEASAGFAREGPTAAGLHRPLSRGAPRLCLSGPCFLLTTNGTEDTGAGKNACLWEERLDKVRRLLDPRSERHMNIFMPI